MERKQSSVEWLLSQFEEYGYDGIVLENVVEKAKAMHKEDVIKAYREGRSDQQSKETFYHRNSGQYYNETFGGENE